MAMAIDSRQHGHLGGMAFDHMRYAPHFTNPWVTSTASTPSTQLYATSLAPLAGSLDSASQAQAHRPAPVSLSYGAGLSISAPSLGPDLMNTARSYANAYSASTAGASVSSYAPTSSAHYSLDYISAPSRTSPFSYGQEPAKRVSHQIQAQQQAERDSFSEALDASQGMVALGQDLTPRNIYGNQGPSRATVDSYGFPSAHSTHSAHSAHSSISSTSTYPYYDSATASSVTDYSSASESVEGMPARTLPRPSGLVGMPPAPQSMMGQFSSKVASGSQKKHKCKICGKRFTRPSSLLTHTYSHTGEKPHACKVPGCGRHFSVVSNLRRHLKVHKGNQERRSPDEL